MHSNYCFLWYWYSSYIKFLFRLLLFLSILLFYYLCRHEYFKFYYCYPIVLWILTVSFIIILFFEYNKICFQFFLCCCDSSIFFLQKAIVLFIYLLFSFEKLVLLLLMWLQNYLWYYIFHLFFLYVLFIFSKIIPSATLLMVTFLWFKLFQQSYYYLNI